MTPSSTVVKSIVILSMLCMAGCAGFQEWAKNYNEQQEAQRAAQQAAWDSMTPYQQQQIILQRQQLALQQQQLQQQQQYQMQQQFQPQPLPSQRSTNCTSNMYGNTVYTNCN